MLRQLFRQDGFGIGHVQMRKIYEQLAHRFIQDDGIALLHELAHDFTLVVLNNQDLITELRNVVDNVGNADTHFLWLDHTLNDDQS